MQCNVLYRSEDIKLINSVKPQPYVRKGNIPDKAFMSEVFFRSKHANETLGVVLADKQSVVGQLKQEVNVRHSDEFEFQRLSHWEKNYSTEYSEDQWNQILKESAFADSVAKIFWLSDHLRSGGKIEFPITQAWNRYHLVWETVVGNARIMPLRLFCKEDAIEVIRFKAEFCDQDIKWTKIFNSLDDVEEYFGHGAVINYRAWGGSLIPGVHFYNKNKYTPSKLEYQNKLARYFAQHHSLGIDKDKSLYWNINNILDGIHALV